MLGYWYQNGAKVTVDVLRRKEFVTGNAKMQYASRGVVELADGTIRTFGVRHNPDEFGHHHVVSDPIRWTEFDALVNQMREMDAEWITEELDEYRRNTDVLPILVREEKEGETW